MLRKLGWSLMMVAAIVGFAVTAFAQEESVFEGEERESSVHEAGIPIGAFIFSPTIELIYEDKDNIFLTETNEVSDKVYIGRGRLMFELPFAENYFRITYMPQWRDYDKYDFTEHWSHFLDFNVALDTPSGFELKLDNHLVRGVLEVPEVDPGRELVYGSGPFLSDRANVTLGYSITETDFLGVNMAYTTVNYDDPCSNTGQEVCFYDYDTLVGNVVYRRELNPLLRLSFKAGVNDTNVDGTADYRNNNGWDGEVRLDGEIAPRLSAKVGFGYREMNFDSVAGQTDQQYHGTTLDGSVEYQIGETASVELQGQRQAYLSNFRNNAYYHVNKVGIDFESKLVGGLFGTLGGFYQKNIYPKKSFDYDGSLRFRSDKLSRAFIGLGYHFNDLLSVRGNYRWEKRDSNLRGLSYEANTILVNLIFGY